MEPISMLAFTSHAAQFTDLELAIMRQYSVDVTVARELIAGLQSQANEKQLNQMTTTIAKEAVEKLKVAYQSLGKPRNDRNVAYQLRNALASY